MTSIKVKFRPSTAVGREGSIYYQVIRGRVVRQVRTEYRVFDTEWDKGTSSVRILSETGENRKRYLRQVTEHIDMDIRRLKTIVSQHERQGGKYSADSIVGMFNRQTGEQSLVPFMQGIIGQLKQFGKLRTSETYTAALASFMKFREGQDVLLCEMDSNTIMLYDITTLYFEAADEDDLRRTGYSKDGKFDCPQVLLGLLITHDGLPISYEIFEGDLSEKKTFIPLLKRAQEKFGFPSPVVIADAGLLSRKNIEALVEDGYEYVLGARIKNENAAVKQRILALNLHEGEVASIRTDDNLRIVVSYTEKRRKKDAFNRVRGLQRLQEKVASGRVSKKHINNRGYNKYLRLQGGTTISIDIEAFEQDAVWDGLKGYVTNTKMTDEEVIANYHNLWFIERAFRMNKTDLRIRPMYHRLRNRIGSHICICFCAYVLQLEIERLLKAAKSNITMERARELQDHVRPDLCQTWLLSTNQGDVGYGC